MQIQIDDAGERGRLAAALQAAGCATSAEGSLLRLAAPEAEDQPTELELRFFVRAWLEHHPHVSAILL